MARVLIVLKYGGNAMNDGLAGDALLDDVAERVAAGDRVVLVHGGGPQIDASLRERGIDPIRIGGLRITDAATLGVTESVLCGTVNKALVRALLARGVPSVGVSGQDGALLIGRYAKPSQGVDLGFVGDVESVRISLLEALLRAGFVPVIAPLAVTWDGSTALNVNADIAAGAIAGALRADAYVVFTNVPNARRVRDDPATAMVRLSVSEARGYLADGTFEDGMRPKVEGVLDALARGARSAVIAGTGRKALTQALAGNGTTIVPG